MRFIMKMAGTCTIDDMKLLCGGSHDAHIICNYCNMSQPRDMICSYTAPLRNISLINRVTYLLYGYLCTRIPCYSLAIKYSREKDNVHHCRIFAPLRETLFESLSS